MSFELWLIVVVYMMVFVGWLYAVFGLVRLNEKIDSSNEWRRKEHDTSRDDYWNVRRDINLLAGHLNVEFVDKHERIVVKKGSPEQP